MAVRSAVAPGVVTPEAVRLEFQAAGIGTRSLALLIDAVIMFVAILVVLVATGLVVGAGAQAGLPEWVGVTIVLLGVFGILWGYPAGLEAVWGRTVGKAALGLRVVTREGAPIGFRHAAIRAALGLVDFYLTLGGAAVLSALISRRQQRLGDLVAGTLVLRERSAAGRPRAVRFAVPPGWESYAATLDPAVLSPLDYQTVRAFMLRAQELTPEVRAAVGREIADPLAARLGHAPPPQVTPELFLLCLAARYQQRGG
jgi:uncharacterized RDD family membrane protein YckC